MSLMIKVRHIPIQVRGNIPRFGQAEVKIQILFYSAIECFNDWFIGRRFILGHGAKHVIMLMGLAEGREE